MAVKPISPDEVQTSVPDEVIEVFNELISENFVGNLAVVKQDRVIKRILEKMPAGLTRETIFEKRWLNVEPLYQQAGWLVKYEKPCWDENFDAYFTFTKPTLK